MVKEFDRVLRVGEELADYVLLTSFDDLPGKVVHQAGRVVLDSLGTMLMGARRDEASGLTGFLRDVDRRGCSTVVGSPNKTCASLAAFANACYAQVHDCNDGHRMAAAYGGSSHPGRVAVPTSLALGEELGASGREVVTSIVVGYDVATRIRGMGERPPSSTYCVAAIAGRMLGLDRDQLRYALGIAGYHSPSGYPGERGYDTNFLGNGYHARIGVESALLARNGLKGPPLGDDGRLSTRFVERGLGEEYEVMNVYFKPYPACRMTHGAIEGVLRIKEETGLMPGDVEEIRIKQLTHGMYITDEEVGVDSYYKTCQFNLPYVVACAVADGEVGEEQFTRERIADPMVHRLAEKVEVVPDETLDAVYPMNNRPTLVNVRTRECGGGGGGGETFSSRIDYPKGDPRNPLSDEELYQKFVRWSGSSITPTKAEEIRDIVNHLEHLDDINNLTELLEGPS